jgi:lipopolysaccharide/colanic/teichoic acid biosynthesis glycosyltransferase
MMSKDARAVTVSVPRSPCLEEPPAATDDAVAAFGRPVVAEAPEPHFAYGFTKRVLDALVATTGLVLLSPVFLIIAAVNSLSGPVLYEQRRLGLGGREFTCLKFRSMVPRADELRSQLDHLNITNGPTFKVPSDPRLTKFGRFLRATSLDELPQLLNVLRGEMSLVGPRPLAVEENRYEGMQHLRLSVRPGLTCIWQVSGRSKIGFAEWMEMDLEYVRTRSLLTDLRLLLRTIPAVIRCEGAF